MSLLSSLPRFKTSPWFVISFQFLQQQQDPPAKNRTEGSTTDSSEQNSAINFTLKKPNLEEVKIWSWVSEEKKIIDLSLSAKGGSLFLLYMSFFKKNFHWRQWISCERRRNEESWSGGWPISSIVKAVEVCFSLFLGVGLFGLCVRESWSLITKYANLNSKKLSENKFKPYIVLWVSLSIKCNKKDQVVDLQLIKVRVSWPELLNNERKENYEINII